MSEVSLKSLISGAKAHTPRGGLLTSPIGQVLIFRAAHHTFGNCRAGRTAKWVMNGKCCKRVMLSEEIRSKE